MMIGKLELTNPDKLARAEANVGDKAKPSDILAEYDRLGGLIKQHEKTGARNVQPGCFWDFENNKAIKKPKIVLQ